MEFFSRLLIKSAYFLNGSRSYQNTKIFFYNFLENNSYPYKKYFDAFMIFLIFSSVLILIREVKFHLDDAYMVFNDYIISIIFLFEYLLRMWVYNSSSDIIIKQHEDDEFLQRRFKFWKSLKNVFLKKIEYARSPTAIIDFLAIVPFFHQLRLLRVFIIFRVFKLFRYAKSLRHLLSVLTHKRFELITLLIFATIVVFISGVLIYVMEANNPESPIDTLFGAFYWALVTISTVGYGDLAPISSEGRAVAMVIIVSGIAVLSFSTSIIVSAFTERMDEIVENKLLSDVNALKKFYLICGYGEVAQSVANKLRHGGNKVVVLDSDALHIKEAKTHQLTALQFDPGALESYKLLDLNLDTQVKAILCLNDNDVQNVYTALTIRSMNKEVMILSILKNENNRKKLELAGINEIVYAQKLVGMVAKEYSGKPVAFEAIHLLRSEQSDVVTEEVVVDEYIKRNFQRLEEINMHKRRIILLGIYGVGDQKFLFNPAQSTVLNLGDILVVMGTVNLIKELKKYLHLKLQS
ncbi:MAG: ion transporter [Campylobacterota bacterium]|nr:ion transporter [Campylobacterota bacterium]